MDILLNFDEKYAPHAAVVMASLCLNNKGEHVFHVISSDLSQETECKLRQMLLMFDSELDLIEFKRQNVQMFPIGKGTANNYISIEAYFRLYVTDLLPESIHRLLYLDCDLVVCGSIDDLWHWQFGTDKCVGAIEDKYSISKRAPKRLGYPEEFSYFNSGVMLFEMDTLRQYYETKLAIDYIQKNRSLIRFHDQDVLNALLYSKVEFIPMRYNVLDCCYVKKAVLPSRYEENREALLSPAIIHFSSQNKPWMKTCKHPFKPLYYKYLNHTPWAGTAAIDGPKPSKCTQLRHALSEWLHIKYYYFSPTYDEACYPYL